MRVKDFFKLIETDFPKKLALKWDHCGYQCGIQKENIENVIVCLDLTKDVMSQAIENKVQVIITHHPFFFEKIKKERKISYKKLILDLLQEHQIVVYTTHTNYDEWMNELILQELKAKTISSIPTDRITKQGLVSLTPNTIIEQLKTLFAIPVVQHNLDNLNTPISSVVICAGAGGSIIKQLPRTTELFITGEMKWNEWIIGSEHNIPIICFNHSMENFYIKSFALYLKQKFPTMKIIEAEVKNIINYG